MIKTTLGTLNVANTPNQGGQPSSLGKLMLLPMKVSLAWKRLSLLEALEAQLDRYHRLRNEIITKNSNGDERGVHPKHPNYTKTIKEIDDLNNIEIEIDADPIRLQDLDDECMSPLDLRELKFLLVP
jgi:hypothetical protein